MAHATTSSVRIVLMRHGKPSFDHRGWISSRDMPMRIEKYNDAGVADDAPAAAVAEARAATCIVASTLPRSHESARMLALGREVFYGRQFREPDLPYREWRWPALPYRLWITVFRVAWLFGFSERAESTLDAEARARRAARRLVEMARERGSVLLVGHGIMNRLIAKQLVASGAVRAGRMSGGYWSYGVFEIKR